MRSYLKILVKGRGKMKLNNKRVQRGEIYWCDLGEAVGSEQGGCRPVIIVQNDIGNNYSTTTIVVPLTTKIKKTKLPTHHEFINNGVKQVACAEQIRTVDKLRLGTNLGFVRKEDVDKISRCVHIAVEEIKFQPKQAHRNAAVPSREVKEEYALEHKDRSDFVNRTIYPEPKQTSVHEEQELEELVVPKEESGQRKYEFKSPPKPKSSTFEKNNGNHYKAKRSWDPSAPETGDPQDTYRGKHSYKNRKKTYPSKEHVPNEQGKQIRKKKSNFKKEEGKM